MYYHFLCSVIQAISSPSLLYLLQNQVVPFPVFIATLFISNSYLTPIKWADLPTWYEQGNNQIRLKEVLVIIPEPFIIDCRIASSAEYWLIFSLSIKQQKLLSWQYKQEFILSVEWAMWLALPGRVFLICVTSLIQSIKVSLQKKAVQIWVRHRE